MEKILSLKSLNQITSDTTIDIAGIIHNQNKMGKFSFVTLRLIDGFIQCIYDEKAEDQPLKNESSVILSGRKVPDERARNGFEIHIEQIKILSAPFEEAPVIINKGPCKLNMETDLNYRPFTLRNSHKRDIFKLQAGILKVFRQFLENTDFTEISSPKITASGAEGGANIFKLDYFGKKAFLAQSPQFYKQMMIPVFGRVYEIGPVFRAEKHDTKRHLNEYISVDLEIGFIESFEDIMDMETRMLQYLFEFLKTNCSALIETLKIEIPEIKGEIPKVRFKDAKEMVSKRYGRKIKDPHDLEPEEERLISELFKEDTGSDFVFVTHYPVKKRPFYAMDDPENEKCTLSFDLLFRGMEITTGGQRIHGYQMQKEKMLSKGLDPADFSHYLMLHKYGCPPHGGMGLGLERFLMKLTGCENIRSTALFPRDTQRLLP